MSLYLRPGTSEQVIQANIEALIMHGQSLKEADEIARAFAEQERTGAFGLKIPKDKEETDDQAVKVSVRPVPGHTVQVSVQISPQLPSSDFHVVGKGSKILIVKGAPTAVELLRGEPFVNDDRIALEKFVLEPLGLRREDVMLAWAKNFNMAYDFAKACKLPIVLNMQEATTGDEAWRNLPSLEVLKSDPRRGGEMARKLTSVRKKLDATATRVHSRINLVHMGAMPSDAGTILAPIRKRAPVQQMVFGVVLDPYQVDAQNDWVPPAEIERTAYGYMIKSRTIGFQHQGPLPDATLISSAVEDYPSEDDREKALLNLPHKAYARKFGNDVVHSGAWVMGVKLSDRLWALAEKGEIDAFSIEGFGIREPIETTTAMPQVTFIELGEVKRAVGRFASD